ncbi:O-antigen ligase family protein [Myroides sp. WP-1]|uniref:O-antigen ligase family protein n=1 Tax=Myroides sp. WP-1 TaxID=2759944 RepID=UPI0015FD7737|nr:O-antigen ligase family protein [Myroides sp. WP-1]MBB1139439.1 O-antigen ligase family protein [Myroides sp. WP-1]
MKEKAITIIKHTLLATYVGFLVFNFKIINLALLALLLFFLVTFKENRAQLFANWKENRLIYGTLLAMIVFQWIHGVIFDDLSEKRFGFLAILFASSTVLLWIKDIRFILYCYLSCLLLLVVIGSYNLLQYYLTTDYFTINKGGHIDTLLVVARPYVGFMLNIGILISLYLSRRQNKYKLYFILLSLLFLTYLAFIGNRIQIVSLILVALLYGIFYMKTNWIKKAIGLFGFSMAIVLLFALTPTLKERFELNSLSTLDNLVSRLEQKEPRVLIWKCAFSFTHEDTFNPIQGLGKVKTLDDKLAQCYEDNTHGNPMRDYFLEALFNTHNQFIEYYVLTGVVGGGLLCLLFAFLLVKVKRFFIPIALTCSLFNFCFVENLFNRQLGVYLFGFVLTLIVLLYKQQLEDTAKN